MRKFFLWIFTIPLLIITVFLLYKGDPSGKQSLHTVTVPITSISPVVKGKSLKKTLFIPYWTMGDTHIDTSDYDTVIYFGITADKEGIDTGGIGYKSIDNFTRLTSKDSKRLLGVQLINTAFNQGLLKNSQLQKAIINQSIKIAKKKGFQGVVLDFEISALGFDSVTKTITSFETHFADTTKGQQLLFYPTIYGDTFARFRPFDGHTIAAHSDGILIMAYDYHKASGNPGPNFPLKDNQNEGYDFESMVDDFLQQVPANKITVVFGLFGYDRIVDAKGNSIGEANSLSDYKIEQKFLQGCAFSFCKIVHDPISAETNITYRDNSDHHSVWFEDQQSVNKKSNFLLSKGINTISYWAYSYF